MSCHCSYSSGELFFSSSLLMHWVEVPLVLPFNVFFFGFSKINLHTCFWCQPYLLKMLTYSKAFANRALRDYIILQVNIIIRVTRENRYVVQKGILKVFQYPIVWSWKLSRTYSKIPCLKWFLINPYSTLSFWLLHNWFLWLRVNWTMLNFDDSGSVEIISCSAWI